VTDLAAGAGSCKELFARLSEYIDGELDESICAGIESHLGDCPPCQRFLESLRRTVGLLESMPRPPVEIDPRLREELRAAFDRLRRTQDPH